jgi:PPK2 family polyphosphate:nucleotide phosphotransferase
MARASRLVISSRRAVRLRDVSPDPPKGVLKDRIKEETARLGEALAELDDLLTYAREHAVLVVLQGRDTAGKDGTIRKILDHTNALGVRVESFKVPTEVERGHDFLWRVHAKTPARGEIVLFNRSHYEDVLVTRVHGLFPPAVIDSRYETINDFERLLSRERTLIFKFFLHISREEQEVRLLEREAEREKAWKLAVGDWKEREHWDAYTRAYETAMSRCSMPHAPWYIVPANAKWYRNYVVLKTIVDELSAHKSAWLTSLSTLGKTRRAELDAFRRASRHTQ